MKSRMESWEKPKIRVLLIKAFAASLVGLVCVVLISFLFNAIGWGHASLALLAFPWIMTTIFIIPVAYHQGACDERQRSKTKTNVEESSKES